MEATDQPAHGDFIGDELDTVVGVIWRGNVVKCQQNASDRLINCDEEGCTAEGEEPVYFRDLSQIFL